MAKALRQNIPQIVFLGAGYDTRSYRFANLIRETRIFELDIAATQQRKKQLLRQANVSIPAQLAFVAIDLERDALVEVLLRTGFEQNKKKLFVWEGVTYYLSVRAVDETLAFLKSYSPTGSIFCFDYIHAPDVSSRYGVETARETNEVAHDPIFPLVYFVHLVLAAGAAGTDTLSHRLAALAAVSPRWHRRGRRV